MIQPLNPTPQTPKKTARRSSRKSKFLREVTKPFPNSQKVHVATPSGFEVGFGCR